MQKSYIMQKTDDTTMTIEDGLIVNTKNTDENGSAEIQVISLEDPEVPVYSVFPVLVVMNLWIRGIRNVEIMKEDIVSVSGHDYKTDSDFITKNVLVYSKGEIHVTGLGMSDCMRYYEALYLIAVEIFGIQYVYDQLKSSGVPKEYVHPSSLEPFMECSENKQVTFEDRRRAIGAVKDLYAGLAVIRVKDTTKHLLDIGKLLELDTSMVKDHNVEFYERYYCDKNRRQILPVTKKCRWDRELPAETLEKVIRRVKES